MLNFIIRPIKTADLSAILAIEQEQAYPWTLGILQDCLAAGYENWLLEVNSEVVGFGLLRTMGREAEILNLVTKTTHQRQGYARVLLKHLISIAQQKGASQIFLEVRVSNIAAINLYQQLAFKMISQRKDYYPAVNGREDALILLLDLSR